MKILVTGGTGYIGSHTVVELLGKDYDVTVLDNLENSAGKVINRIEEIAGKRPEFIEADVRDESKLREIVQTGKYDAVIHFAALKAVGESAQKPLEYFDVNVGGTIALLKAIQGSSVKKFVFSSSATVYGTEPYPYKETTAFAPTNPYGHTKVAVEFLLKDQAAAELSTTIISLRYFNPIGAHPSGKIGEDPKGIPNNIMPYIAQVASGKRDKLTIFGNDYSTPDGTCVRDYIHVVDLAKGHVAALEKSPETGFKAYNLGSGKGTSVLELVKAFETSTGKKLAYEFGPNRAGDLPEFYADPTLAKQELGWQTEQSIEDACRDTWNWQSQNPNGFAL